MHITSISPSSYSQYDDCKMKYFISNVLKIREPAGDAALKGTMVHYFFEILGKIKKANQEGLSEIEIANFKKYSTNIPTDAEIPPLFDEIFEHFCNTQKLDKKYHKECYDHVLAVIGGPEDVRNLWIVDTEKRFSIELPFDWAKYDIPTEESRERGYIAVNGIIDLVVKKPDGSMQVLDYKGLALDTKIPTIDGWKTMETLEEGDVLFDIDGNQTTVIGKSQVKNLKCFEIVFDDTSRVTCDEEHLWTLLDNSVVNVKDLKKNDKIAIAKPIYCEDKELPIHPYLLGVWLGDGRNRGCSISGTDSFIFDKIEQLGYKIGPDISCKSCPERTIYNMTNELRKLNLLHNKHIPAIYLRASYNQRLELLRGLMDSDGSVNPTRKQCVFTNCNKLLSDNTKELILSLGNRVLQSHVFVSYKGRKVDVYPLSFRNIAGNPFSLPRKKDAINKDWGPGHSAFRTIVSVTEVKSVSTQCIKVDSPSSTFLCTENFIPTHNTGKRKDWITGKLKDEAYLKNDIQLKIYDAALRLLYPEIPDIRICIFFTKDGGPFYPILDKDSAEDTWKKIKERVTEIRANELPVQNRSFRCKFCYYSKIKFNDAPKEFRRYQLNEIGEKMCACSHLSTIVKEGNIAAITEKYKYGKNIDNPAT